MLLDSVLLLGREEKETVKLEFSYDGRFLARSESFSGVTVWETGSGRFAQKPDEVSALATAFASNKPWIVLLSAVDLKVYNLETNMVLLQLPRPKECIPDSWDLYFDGTCDVLYLVGEYSVLKYHLCSSPVMKQVRIQDNETPTRLFSNQQSFYLLSEYEDPTSGWGLRVSDIRTGERIVDVKRPRHYMLSHNGLWLAVSPAGPGLSFQVWRLTDGSLASEFHIPESALQNAVLSFDGALLIASLYTPARRQRTSVARIETRDAKSGAIVSAFDSPFAYTQLSACPNRVLVALVGSSSPLVPDRTHFFDPITGKLLASSMSHPCSPSIEHVYSPCGRWFATPSAASEMSFPSKQYTPGTVVLTDCAPILPMCRPTEIAMDSAINT